MADALYINVEERILELEKKVQRIMQVLDLEVQAHYFPEIEIVIAENSQIEKNC